MVFVFYLALFGLILLLDTHVTFGQFNPPRYYVTVVVTYFIWISEIDFFLHKTRDTLAHPFHMKFVLFV